MLTMGPKNIPPKLLYLLSIFFIVQLAVNLGNYTSLVYSAVAFSGISRPAFLVTFQTLGSLMAFLLLNNGKTSFSHKMSLRTLTLLNAAFAFLSSNILNFYLWVFFVMGRIALSTILVARLQALLPPVAGSKEETQSNSKFMQSLYMLASLITLSLSPIVQQFLGVSKVYIIDMALMLAVWLAITVSGLWTVREEDAAEAGGRVRLSAEEILSFSPYVAWMWLVAGAFHIIEIPYLTKVVKTSAGELTLLFMVAGIGAILGSIFVPKQFISINKHKTAFWSSALISVISIVYLCTVNLPGIMLILFFFGILNAAFNVSVANIIYDRVPGSRQTAAFAFYRLNSNLCVIAAALVMSSLSDIELAFRGQIFLTAAALFLFAGLTAVKRTFKGGVL